MQYTLKGIRRSQGDSPRLRLPITISALRDLKTQLHHSRDICLHDKRMLWASFCLAFYGFLRASEYTSRYAHSFDAQTTLCRRDLQLTQSSIAVTLKASKTDPFRQGCTLHIAATSTSTCPAAALAKYLSLSKTALPETPLFRFHDGTYLTRQTLTIHIRNLLTMAGYEAAHFASHSFRIGAATTAAAAGLPDWTIQALGRWSSSCYTLYIRTPPQTLAATSRQLAAVQYCPTSSLQ